MIGSEKQIDRVIKSVRLPQSINSNNIYFIRGGTVEIRIIYVPNNNMNEKR